MPANTKIGIIIQDIPLDATPEQFAGLVNNRFLNLQGAINEHLVRQESEDDVDIGGNRVVNVGDPVNDLDVVNLRTLKKVATAPKKEDSVQPKANPDVVDQHFAIYFTKDGFVADDEESPYATIDEHREGYPISALITSKTAPASETLKVNFKVLRVDQVDTEDLIEIPLEIAIDAKGPTFSDLGLKITEKLAKGTILYMKIVKGGDAQQVVGQITMRRAL